MKYFWICFIFIFACNLNTEKVKQQKEGKKQEDLIRGMVLVPKGEFIMGSSKVDKDKKGGLVGARRPFYMDEHPEHREFLNEYYIDRYEVTNAQYSLFNPRHTYSSPKYNHPVVDVIWNEADQYCRYLGKKLPTEAQWEKAARGTDGREYPWGNEFDLKKTNSGEDPGDTTPVGSYEEGKSPYGVYDLAGNVWEWTRDWYQQYTGGDYQTPDYGKKYKVVRGGSRGGIGHYNLAHFSRSAHRLPLPPQSAAEDTGFRCVVEING